MCADPKSAKKTDNLTVFFVLLGFVWIKTAYRMLMKLTPCRSVGMDNSNIPADWLVRRWPRRSPRTRCPCRSSWSSAWRAPSRCEARRRPSCTDRGRVEAVFRIEAVKHPRENFRPQLSCHAHFCRNVLKVLKSVFRNNFYIPFLNG